MSLDNYKNMNMDNDSKEISHEFNLETHPNSINNRKAISAIDEEFIS